MNFFGRYTREETHMEPDVMDLNLGDNYIFLYNPVVFRFHVGLFPGCSWFGHGARPPGHERARLWGL